MKKPHLPNVSESFLKEQQEKALNEANPGGYAVAETTLIEQVRNKRAFLTERYTRQMQVLNELERTLKSQNPEEIIARVKDNLQRIDWM